MKLQAGYEMFVTITIFIIVIIFLFYEILSSIPGYLIELKKETLYSEAYKISQILINDGGEPSNWFVDVSSAKRIGLLNESLNSLNILSSKKIDIFNRSCVLNYEIVKKLIGTDYNIGIVLRLSNGSILINCGVVWGEDLVKISRIVSLDDFKSYGELILWVY